MAILGNIIQKPVIDLSTNEGNTFFLIAQIVRLGPKFGIDVKSVVAEMTSDDYMNALLVFDREMGNYIDLRLPEAIQLEVYEKQATAKQEAFTLQNIVHSIK